MNQFVKMDAFLMRGGYLIERSVIVFGKLSNNALMDTTNIATNQE
jgi:hypothetical protein